MAAGREKIGGALQFDGKDTGVTTQSILGLDMGTFAVPGQIKGARGPVVLFRSKGAKWRYGSWIGLGPRIPFAGQDTGRYNSDHQRTPFSEGRGSVLLRLGVCRAGP